MRVDTGHALNLTRIAMRGLLSVHGSGAQGGYAEALCCPCKHANTNFTRSIYQADIYENMKTCHLLSGHDDDAHLDRRGLKKFRAQFGNDDRLFIPAEEVA